MSFSNLKLVNLDAIRYDPAVVFYKMPMTLCVMVWLRGECKRLELVELYTGPRLGRHFREGLYRHSVRSLSCDMSLASSKTSCAQSVI